MVRTVQFRQQKVGSYTYWFSTCNTLLMICHKVFVIRCLYSAVSLTLVREERFIRMINYYYHLVSLQTGHFVKVVFVYVITDSMFSDESNVDG